MSDEKFAPGEWKVCGNYIHIGDECNLGNILAVLCDGESCYHTYAEQREIISANAALIAAAPAMYKELENIEDYLRFLVAGCVAGSGRAKALWAFIDRIITIRKKARGEE